MSAAMLAAVAAGGAVGALLRAAALRLGRPGHRLPYATLAVNVIGSFFIGCLAVSGMNPLWAAGTISGVLGSFTTYSTFAVESVKLSNGRVQRSTLLYISLTLVGCTSAAGLGLWIAEL
jgi:CrcB protein